MRGEDDEWQANARLIAAAPELYEALDSMVRNYGLHNEAAATACRDALAALAKARGDRS